MTPPQPRFCGQCGAPLEAGTEFCGECGAPAEARASAPTQPVSEWAPRPPNSAAPMAASPAPAPRAEPAPRSCQNCGTRVTPGKRFCRKCGTDVTSGKQPAPAQPPAPAPTAAPKAPGRGKRAFRKTIGILVPAVSIVVTYYLSNKLLGPMLAKQFGDSARQIGSMLVSMLVGAIARQIMR